MIDIKKEMEKTVDHPIPYLIDLIGRLVKERDKALDLCVKTLYSFEEKEGGEISKSEFREWVEGQI
jgi:hypothetical protein